uniref:CIA30 domain-containing protein n=1 Tax=Macrostomum lignano TaxID=282301 RepID=A0A1I8FKH9_9PLAT
RLAPGVATPSPRCLPASSAAASGGGRSRRPILAEASSGLLSHIRHDRVDSCGLSQEQLRQIEFTQLPADSGTSRQLRRPDRPPSGGNYRHSHNNSYQAAVSDTETDPNRRYQPLVLSRMSYSISRRQPLYQNQHRLQQQHWQPPFRLQDSPTTIINVAELTSRDEDNESAGNEHDAKQRAHFEWSQGTTFRVDQGRHFGSRGRHFRMMSSGATLGVGRALLSDGVTGHHFRVESGATFESEAARHFRMEQLAPLWESAGATYWMESGAHFRAFGLPQLLAADCPLFECRERGLSQLHLHGALAGTD